MNLRQALHSSANVYSYTCGAQWNTCSCTERDQVQRRAELAARRAAVHAEEQELRAALEAIAEAERREQEEREQEHRRLEEEARRAEQERIEREEARVAAEMQQLQRMEAARIEKITQHYTMLRLSMRDLHKLQRKKILDRHKSEVQRSIEELEKVMAKKDDLEAAEAQSQLEREEKLQRTREKQAQITIQTFARHRVDQNQLFDSLSQEANRNSYGGDPPPHVTAIAEIIEEMMALQESERAVLKERQQRELQRLQSRAMESFFVSSDHDEQMLALQEEKQKMTEEAHNTKQEADADCKWMALVFNERSRMLVEDERRLVESGGEAPDILVMTPVSTKEKRTPLLKSKDSLESSSPWIGAGLGLPVSVFQQPILVR